VKRPRRRGGRRASADDGDRGAPAGDEGDRTDAEAPAEGPARRQAAKPQRGEAASASSRAARRSLADRVGKAAGDEAGKGAAARPEPARPASDPAPAAATKAGEGDTASAQPEPEPKSKPQSAGEPNRPRRQAGAEPRDRDAGKDRDRAAGKERGREAGKPRDRAAGKPRDRAAGAKRDRDAGKPRDRAAGKKEDGGTAGAERRRPPVARAGERHPGAGRRERRRRAGKRPAPRPRAAAAAAARALKRGAARTRRWTAENAPKAGRRLLAALAAVFAVFFAALGVVLGLLIGAGRVLAGPVRAVLGVLDRAARAASRTLTPARALAVVVAGAAILLALSQYADYRTISIGNDAYSGVQTVAPAPETGRARAGDAHSYVFVAVAIACLLLLAVATVGGRRRACRLITLAGIAAVLVALIVDRPAGLDPGEAAVAFEGVRATLIGGFYAQIAAGVLLIGSSTLLARELRLAGGSQRSPVRSRTGEPAPERPRRRRPPRPGADPEGAARA